MTVMQENLNLIRQIPEERQEEIYQFLLLNFDVDNPFERLNKHQIFEELSESRRQAERGEYQEFDEFLDEVEAKYEL